MEDNGTKVHTFSEASAVSTFDIHYMNNSD